jgi:hypothetical protein
MTGVIASVTVFIAAIPTYLTYLASLIINTLTWVFSIFTYFWNVLDFLLISPSFNIFTTIFTIFGIIIAWLTGTTYTNGWGQVFDFTYLANFSFMGVHGCIVIFMIIFPVAFFVILLSCFAKMSLEPILAPIRLLTSFMEFTMRILNFLWMIAVWAINILLSILHTVKTHLPRIPFLS